ncbi:MAG TPA: pitrilysin family protein [Bacillota bacterium]|nr:pitrilysin family protein [Bacillota bacterium]
MSRNVEKVIQNDGINVHIIPSKKYKTITIVAKLKTAMERDTITKRALLPVLLRQGTKKYPSRELLQDRLDDLYGASLSLDGGKAGDDHVLSVRMEIANEKFIPNESSIIEDGIEFLKEVIFHPNITDNGFASDLVAREKELLKQQLRALKDNKVNFAQMRLIDEMCDGETFQIHAQGYEEDLEAITPQNLYEYYQTVIQDNQLDVYMLGDFNHDEMAELLQSSLGRPSYVRNDRKAKAEITGLKDNRPQEIIEKQDIQQAKLHIGYRTHTTFKDDDFAALLVFNGIFGAFPNSKLFLNVREKHSLAYYVASGLEGFKGIMYVYSGIAGSDYEKTTTIIEEQLNEVIAGTFSEENLEETKALLLNDIVETMDDAQGLIEVMYQNVIGETGIASPEALLDRLKEVTKEDVIRVAKKIEKDTVYLLTSKEANNE